MRRNILAYDLHIQSLLKRINHVPLERHKPSLMEFLRFEIFDIQPLYYWNASVPRMPQHYQNVLKQIRNVEKTTK
jgi:hypothetical protein